MEGGNRKASKSGSGGEDSAFKQQIGGHDSRLDEFDLAAAGRDFTWQQQIVISAVGSNRARLVVAGCRLAAALFSCLTIDSELVSCDL